MSEKKEKIIERGGKKVRIEEVVTKVKRVSLPNEKFYKGKLGFDYNMAFLNYLNRLTSEQKEAFQNGDLICDLDATNNWINSVKNGDVIGAKCDLLRVLEVDSNNPNATIKAEHVQPTKKKIGEFEVVPFTSEKSLSIFDIDFFRELGLLEILWRDFKPYGLSEEEDITVYVFHDQDTKDHE